MCSIPELPRGEVPKVPTGIKQEWFSRRSQALWHKATSATS